MSGDVLVIGAGPAGLAAATYLARSGAHVIALEAEAEPGGSLANRLTVGKLTVPAGSHTLAALDPRVIKDLKLTRLGLKFAARDLPLVGLRGDGKPLCLGRDLHEACLAIAPISQRDAERYPVFRREIFDFARVLRAIWWEEGTLNREEELSELRRLAITSASTLLESTFESEALKATFAFDALAGGMSPSAAGSSLALVWQAAQEMCGLQGAVAIPRGGPAALADVLLKAARNAGVEIRTGARVTQLIVEGDAMAGAVVASGEVVLAETILSSLSRRTTLLDLLPPGAAGFAAARQLERPNETGEGKVVVALNALPPTFKQSARYVIAERLEDSVSARAQARAGRVPSDLAMETVTIETGGEPPFLLSVMVKPLPVVPVDPPKAFVTKVLQTVLRTLERHAPALTANIAGFNFVPARPHDPMSVSHLTASWRERIVTPTRGLFLCGEAAEPLPAVSCRAARIAAGLAGEHLKRGRP